MIRRQSPPLPRFHSPVACVVAFIALAGVARATEVSVTRLDGTTLTGELREWTTAELRLSTPTGEQQIATNQLLSLRWPPATHSPPAGEKTGGSVELIDGSILPAKSIRVEHSDAMLTF